MGAGKARVAATEGKGGGFREALERAVQPERVLPSLRRIGNRVWAQQARLAAVSAGLRSSFRTEGKCGEGNAGDSGSRDFNVRASLPRGVSCKLHA